ncbi:hypothetical protein FEM03_17560 [Phragmitibacter flavus]|uniref:Uncharacterized protein n=1 Tax=Phragmitibacter flavus TaxID=2576071 RepID=A0A5R8KAW6_9BACT|nr:hypothetical protein [Phragmitibacter flavus]TLD69450.1 hypothetical protein FEM03_17560 [Phragmitibacter flavus]
MKIYLRIILGMLLILSPVFWYGYQLGQYEQGAKNIAMHLSSMSDDDWSKVYDTGESLYKKLIIESRNDHAVVPVDKLPPDLKALGFDGATLESDGLYFSIGGGHMLNSASVRIIIFPPEGETQRVEINGWRELRTWNRD